MAPEQFLLAAATRMLMAFAEQDEGTYHFKVISTTGLKVGCSADFRANEIVGNPDFSENIPPMPTTANLAWKWLSPLGEKIISVCSKTEWRTAQEIADLIDIPCTSDFRALLHEYAERGILEVHRRRGYRLATLSA